jgi:putative addiction module CopG family antidote
MTLRLPERWEMFINSQVQSGRFRSGEEVMGEALKLLEARVLKESETLEAIQRGLDAVDAGHFRPVGEVMAELRHEFGMPEE